jgi:hypothetical protein
MALLASGAACAGAAFELLEPAHESTCVAVGAWEVEAVKDSGLVVARGGDATDAPAAFSTGLLTAQKGLDLMCLRGGNNLVLRHFDENFIVWWPEPAGLVVRIVSLAPVRIDVPPITATVTDAAGNVQPPQPPTPPEWHESFRYFRLSQTSDDLFDAYRNAYLALESVLSDICPQQTDAAGRVTEGEGAWFRRALAQADALTPLASVVPAGSGDPVQYLWDELYRDMRSAMSHAKSGRKILLPQDNTERRAVTESLKRLAGLYLELAEAHLGARRMGGGMTTAGFRMAFGSTVDSMTVSVSDDEAPFSKADLTPNPGGGSLHVLTVDSALETTDSFLVTKRWSAPGAHLSGLPFIRRVVGTIDGGITAMAGVLEERLYLGPTQRLEVVLGSRGTNLRQPRTRYSF